jgi:GT2 family glycosyltransferase
MAGPRVAAVVLSWNRRADTLACLRSLAAAEGELEVIVVDNASTDGTPAAVRDAFPNATLIVNDENLGFAAGNNVGLRHALAAGAEWVLVLNNDVEVEPGFLPPLLEAAARRPGAGALSPKILLADPPDVIWFAGASYDPRRGYNGRQRGYGEPDDGRWDELWATDRVCGAAMLVPRTVLEADGLFDEELFAYSEDTDWSLRVRARGHGLWVVPASRVHHRVSAASGGESSPTTLYYDTRNALVVAERHAPLGRFGTWRRRLVVVAAHLFQAGRAPRTSETVAAVIAGWRDFSRGRLGPRRSSR